MTGQACEWVPADQGGGGADGVKVTAAEGLQTIYFLLEIHSTKQFFFFQKFLVYSAHVRDFAV
jgi:hypothetical protein